MAEDAGQIREAIDETRSEIAETMAALGQKADVKSRVAVYEPAGKRAAVGIAVALFAFVLLRRWRRRKRD